jgi:hypothetical protein
VLNKLQDKFGQVGFEVTAHVQSLSERFLVLTLDQWKDRRADTDESGNDVYVS